MVSVKQALFMVLFIIPCNLDLCPKAFESTYNAYFLHQDTAAAANIYFYLLLLIKNMKFELKNPARMNFFLFISHRVT